MDGWQDWLLTLLQSITADKPRSLSGGGARGSSRHQLEGSEGDGVAGGEREEEQAVWHLFARLHAHAMIRIKGGSSQIATTIEVINLLCPGQVRKTLSMLAFPTGRLTSSTL